VVRRRPGGAGDPKREAGDRILFIPQSGLEVDVDGDIFLLLRERDVQAVASDRVDPHAGQYL
jgi:chaperonin GroES